MRKIILLFGLSLYLYAVKIPVHVACDFKPYSYCIEGKVEGIAIDILSALFAKMPNYELDLKTVARQKCLGDSQKCEKRSVKILGMLDYDENRDYISDYSSSFLSVSDTLLCKKALVKPDMQLPKDIFGSKLASPKGFHFNALFQEAIDEKKLSIRQKSLQKGMDALAKGEVDCLVSNTFALKEAILQRKKEDTKAGRSLKYFKDFERVGNVSKKAYYIAFTNLPFPYKENLLKKINLGIQVMKNSGEIEQIIQRYIEEHINPEPESIDIALYNWGNRMVSDSLEGYGIIPESIKAAFESQNIQVNYHFYTPMQAFLLTKWGKVCASMPWLDVGDRRHYFHYSKSLLTTQVFVYFSKKKYPNGIAFEDFFDLMGYKIGGVQGFYYEKEYFLNNKLMRYVSHSSLPGAIKALLRGEVDIVIGEERRFKKTLHENFSDKKEEIGFAKKPLFIQGNHMIFSKNCKKSHYFLEKMRKGKKHIEQNGQMLAIIRKYGLEKEVEESNERQERGKLELEQLKAEQIKQKLEALEQNATSTEQAREVLQQEKKKK